jgi:hypothetical protein
MTVELVFAIGITVYACTLLICVCACLANYRAGVRDGIGYLRDPQDLRYKDAGDLIDAEGLAAWLKQERLCHKRTGAPDICEHGNANRADRCGCSRPSVPEFRSEQKKN